MATNFKYTGISSTTSFDSNWTSPKPRSLTKEELDKAPKAPSDPLGLFPISDLVAFARALRKHEEYFQAKFNYNEINRHKIGVKGSYKISVEKFMTLFVDFWQMRSNIHYYNLSTYINNFYGVEDHTKFAYAAQARNQTKAKRKVENRKVKTQLRPLAWFASYQIMSEQILLNWIKNSQVFVWLPYENYFVLRSKLSSLVKTADNGYISQETAKKFFFKCENNDCGRVDHNSVKRTFIKNASTNPADDTLDESQSESTTKAINCCRYCYADLRDRYGERRVRRILDYSTNPIKIVENGESFRRAKGEHITQDTIYLGVELEVVASKFVRKQYPDRYYDVAQRVCDANLRYKNKMAIIKSDSSIGEDGFEIVSIPGTHLWHTTEGWEDFFREDGPHRTVAGWNHKTCGMHVHVGRNALTSFHIGKTSVFLSDPLNRKFVEHLAGRGANTYNQYNPKKFSDGRLVNRTERREALNIATNKPTVEWRIFQSNVSKHGFMKNIDAVHAITTWTRDCSAAVLLDKKNPSYQVFLAWMEDHRGAYKFLTEWLVKHKYLQEKHKFNPKYQTLKVMEA